MTAAHQPSTTSHGSPSIDLRDKLKGEALVADPPEVANSDDGGISTLWSRALLLVLGNGGVVAVIVALTVVVDRMSPPISRLLIAGLGFVVLLLAILGISYVAASRTVKQRA